MSSILMASGRDYVIPDNDPDLNEYLNRESSYVPTLLHQINVEKLYAFAFEGKKDQVFLDLGANIGLVSLYAADCCKRVIAIEPDPTTYGILRRMTFLFPNIGTLNVALTPYPGRSVFYQNDLNTTASSTVNTYGKPTTVEGMTLMGILSHAMLSHVDFAKIDVEGAEGESLNFDQLRQAKPIIRSYFIETHNCPATSWEHKLSCLVRDLSQLGYHNMKITGMTIYASQ